MNQEIPRFLVRRGTKGWMVWDREKKAPATISKRQLINFETQEQALVALRMFALTPDGKKEDPHAQ